MIAITGALTSLNTPAKSRPRSEPGLGQRSTLGWTHTARRRNASALNALAYRYTLLATPTILWDDSH